jgi:aryl-alcohol dehydrogenase-like predicted oxidoreductase
MIGEKSMEYINIKGLNKKISKIGLGTQPFGNHSEKNGRATVQKAFEEGITLLDTAWIYGHGKSEEVIGNTLKDYDRDAIIIESKTGLKVKNGTTFRDSREETLRTQLHMSLRRLKTSYLDIFYIHWPDPLIPYNETAEVLEKLKDEGLILTAGVSNYTPQDIIQHKKTGTISALQNPYNIFEKAIETELIPFQQKHHLPLMAYRPLCQGLLTGKYRKNSLFSDNSVKEDDPKFKEPRFSQYLNAVEQLKQLAKKEYDKTILSLAIRWVLDCEQMVALWGAWKPEYLQEIEDCFHWRIRDETRKDIDTIVHKVIHVPVGPEFLAPEIRTSP